MGQDVMENLRRITEVCIVRPKNTIKRNKSRRHLASLGRFYCSDSDVFSLGRTSITLATSITA